MLEGFLTLAGFTVLAQAAAGMAIIKALCIKGENLKFELWVFAAILLLGAGTGVSLFHLNYPLRGYLALSNPLESWLSLEIYSVMFFGFTLLLCFIFKTYFLRLLSGIAGAFMVFVMSEVYMFTNSITWDTWNTPVNFFTSALLLGAVSLFSVSLMGKKDKAPLFLGCLPKLIGILVLLRMVAVALLVLRTDSQADVMLMDGHITLTLFGAVVVLTCIMQRFFRYMVDPANNKKAPFLSFWGLAMLLFVFVGEFSGRLMFYMLYLNTGL